MKRFLRWILRRLDAAFTILVTIVAMIFLVWFGFALIGWLSGDGIPNRAVLTLDLRQPITDQPSSKGFPSFARTLSVLDIVQALASAESDARVQGVLVRVGGEGLSYGQAEEIRQALKRLRESGKFVIAHAQAFYGDGLTEYYVAAAADQIWLQPTGEFNNAGIASTAIFLRGLFDKIDAVPQFLQRAEYKSAGDMLMRSEMTPEHREAEMRLLESLLGTVSAQIASDRGIAADALKSAIESAPHLAEEARALKLVDQLGYDDDARQAALDRGGPKAETMELRDYYQAGGSPYGSSFADGTIALIHGEGAIVDGASGPPDLFSDGGAIGGDTIAEAIRTAIEDTSVRAILFRISSPGGSVFASDQVLAALKRAQAAGKPVVVSMGEVAASGGYYVSLAANKIYAWPTTITGSIGVVAGKVAFGGTYALLGVAAQELAVGGQSATMNSLLNPFTPEQLAALNRSIDRMYADFTAKVAEGRHMDIARVQEIARGRVWSGADAMERGLIDNFGGFRDALDEAARLAGIPAGGTVYLKVLPEPKGFFEQLGDIFGMGAAAMRGMSVVAELLDLDSVRAALGAVKDAEALGPRYRMEPVEVR